MRERPTRKSGRVRERPTRKNGRDLGGRTERRQPPFRAERQSHGGHFDFFATGSTKPSIGRTEACGGRGGGGRAFRTAPPPARLAPAFEDEEAEIY